MSVTARIPTPAAPSPSASPSPSTPSFPPILQRYLTLWVLLAGVGGGVLLVASVLCVCRLCLGRPPDSEKDQEADSGSGSSTGNRFPLHILAAVDGARAPRGAEDGAGRNSAPDRDSLGSSGKVATSPPTGPSAPSGPQLTSVVTVPSSSIRPPLPRQRSLRPSLNGQEETPQHVDTSLSTTHQGEIVAEVHVAPAGARPRARRSSATNGVVSVPVPKRRQYSSPDLEQDLEMANIDVQLRTSHRLPGSVWQVESKATPRISPRMSPGEAVRRAASLRSPRAELRAGAEGWRSLQSLREWGALESRLDRWRHEHRRRLLNIRVTSTHLSDDDDAEPKGKVRYNDPGSREELRGDVSIGFSSEGTEEDDEEETEEEVEEDTSMVKTQHETLRRQYQQLWELRATLEEEEDDDDDDADTMMEGDGVEEEWAMAATTTTMTTTSAAAGGVVMEATPQTPTLANGQSQEQSPDTECVTATYTSHTTTSSFESSTTEATLPTPDEAASFLRLTSSMEARRRSYKSVLRSRLGRLPTQSTTGGDSFDSMDSSTDASRVEPGTTSFESTTTTDSATTTTTTGEGGSIGSSGIAGVGRRQHRPSTFRADSGYRSLETNGSSSQRRSTSSSASQQQQRWRQLGPRMSDSSDVSEVPSEPPDHTSLSTAEADVEDDEGVSLSQTAARREALKRRRQLILLRQRQMAALGELQPDPEEEDVPDTPDAAQLPEEEASVIVAPPLGGSSRGDSLESADSRDSGASTSGGGGGGGSSVVVGVGGAVSKTSILARYFRYSRHNALYACRDYSVDEKSDALFREFSRCDPLLDTGPVSVGVGGGGGGGVASVVRSGSRARLLPSRRLPPLHQHHRVPTHPILPSTPSSDEIVTPTTHAHLPLIRVAHQAAATDAGTPTPTTPSPTPSPSPEDTPDVPSTR